MSAVKMCGLVHDEEFRESGTVITLTTRTIATTRTIGTIRYVCHFVHGNSYMRADRIA